MTKKNLLKEFHKVRRATTDAVSAFLGLDENKHVDLSARAMRCLTRRTSPTETHAAATDEEYKDALNQMLHMMAWELSATGRQDYEVYATYGPPPSGADLWLRLERTDAVGGYPTLEAAKAAADRLFGQGRASRIVVFNKDYDQVYVKERNP